MATTRPTGAVVMVLMTAVVFPLLWVPWRSGWPSGTCLLGPFPTVIDIQVSPLTYDMLGLTLHNILDACVASS
jgi:hypothetical protein